jgi:hypothetical protein
MISLIGLRMLVIVIEQLLQALFIIIAAYTFSGKLFGIAIDGLVEDFDVLAVVGDVEGGELGVVAGDDVELVLVLALAQFFVALEEEPGEVPDVVVLGILTYFETGVLEEILIEDMLVDKGSLDFCLVGEVEFF